MKPLWILKTDALLLKHSGPVPARMIHKGTDVGTVTATVVGNTLVVEYAVEAPWYLTETHLWVGKNKSDIPRQAAPGRFPFKATLDFENGWTQIVDLTDPKINIDPAVDVIYVAAHGVVVFIEEFDGVYGLEGLEDLLPIPNVNFYIQANYNTSYHDLFLSQAGDFFNGQYQSYCADPTTGISANTNYTAKMYSSLSAPDNLFPSEKYNEVNWLINNVSVGDNQVNGGELLENPINYADIQMAIWELLYGTPDITDPSNWINGQGLQPVINASTPDNVLQIITAANLNSVFVPGCDEYLVVFLVDLVPNAQAHLIWKKIPCPDFGSETVWAYGEHTFIELGIANKWGWIFEVDCTDE
jgi:hypothetical protein